MLLWYVFPDITLYTMMSWSFKKNHKKSCKVKTVKRDDFSPGSWTRCGVVRKMKEEAAWIPGQLLACLELGEELGQKRSHWPAASQGTLPNACHELHCILTQLTNVFLIVFKTFETSWEQLVMLTGWWGKTTFKKRWSCFGAGAKRER